MALVLRKIYDGYQYFFYEIKGESASSRWWCIRLTHFHFLHEDERSQDFFLISNPPIPFALILVGYVLMVRYGPRFMKSRQPFNLKYIMMVYNFLQVYFNATIASEVRSSMNTLGYPF
jgi:hypothetical protein